MWRWSERRFTAMEISPDLGLEVSLFLWGGGGVCLFARGLTGGVDGS